MLKLAENLIQAVKENREDEVVFLRAALKSYPFEKAVSEFVSDEDKIVFWTNIYNAYFQLIAQKSGQKDPFTSSLFRRKGIAIFNLNLSFDQLEHFILRGAKWKYGLGYLKGFSLNTKLRQLRVRQPDFRIHFLLNCGAISCPVITILSQDNLDTQLDLATADYLHENIAIDRSSKRIVLNTLFLFYLADFGGLKGVRKLLIKHGIISLNEAQFRFKFVAFNSGVKLGNFG